MCSSVAWKLSFAQTVLSHFSIESGEVNAQHICSLEYGLAAVQSLLYLILFGRSKRLPDLQKTQVATLQCLLTNPAALSVRASLGS